MRGCLTTSAAVFYGKKKAAAFLTAHMMGASFIEQ